MTEIAHSPSGVICTNGRFTLRSAAGFKDLPEQKWMIDGVLPRSGLASIYGPSGVGKTFLALDMAFSVSMGLDWFGHTCMQTPVVYLALEGQGGIRNRVHAWGLHHDLPWAGAVAFVFDSFSLLGNEPSNLAELVAQYAAGPMIIIDTLNRAASGADENSAAEMGRIVSGATRLQQATEGLVLMIHHPGKDESRGLRGHSSLHAALDAVIEVKRDGNRYRWLLAKSKDGDDAIGHSFEMRKVDLGQDKSGRAASSLAVVEVGGEISEQRRPGPTGTHQKAILSAFGELWLDKKMQCSATDENWPDGIPYAEALSLLANCLETVDARHRRQRTDEALGRLVAMGYLIRSGDLLALPPDSAT